MLFNLANILVFLGLAAFMIGAILGIGWLLRPATPDKEKAATYECGETPLTQAWFNFNPRFYIVAIIFLIFDVEIALTFPVVTVLRRWVRVGSGAVAVLEIALFQAVLAVGLAYVWRKGDLEWVRTLAGERPSKPGPARDGAPVAVVTRDGKAA